MSVHDPAKFQQYSVIFAKSAADTKNRMFFRDRALFMVDTVFVIQQYFFTLRRIYLHVAKFTINLYSTIISLILNQV